jgi:hypothetical protein
MPDSLSEPSIWTMKLHDMITFDTPRGEVDVLRVADG